MRRSIRILPLLVFFVITDAVVADVGSLPAKGKRWALVIGVDRYDDPQIGRLEGAAADAKALRDALVATAGFPADQVTLIATGESKERLPTRVNILKALTNITSLIPRDGLLLLAFSGHGIDRNGQAYLLPSDAQIHDDVSFLAETAVRLQWIHEKIRGSRVSQVLLLLDACRNDPGGRADAPNRLSEAYTKAFRFETRNDEISAFATLYATAIGQRAYEYTERRQGYFTWAVVNALQGAAANDRGEVTLSRLVAYVQDTVAKRVAVDLGGGRQQRPFATIEGYRADELVVAYVPTRIAPPTPSPAPASGAYMSIDPKAIELKVWEAAERLNTAAAYEEYLRQYPNGTWTSLARMNHAALRGGGADLLAAEQAYEQGDYAAARQNLEKGLAAGDANAQARLGSLMFLCLGGPCDLPAATRHLEEAARRGSHDAEAWLALLWITRGGDYVRAVKLARASAERGELKGVLALAYAYDDGLGVAPDRHESDRYYRLAYPGLRTEAASGDPFMQNSLGNIFRNGRGGIARDDAKAAELFRKAADQGYSTAQFNLATMYAAGLGGLAKDEKKAVELYSRAASVGNRFALYEVGRFYELGQGGLSKSDAKAVESYRRAAQAGDLDAQNRLGELYEDGTAGLPKDVAKALDMYREAADGGHTRAQVNLGLMYDHARGVPRDDAKAVDYYRKAAEGGNARGQALLGWMYAHGEGVGKNEAKAVELYRQAVDQRDSSGQAYLGLTYANGQLGLPKDDAKALEFYRLAAQSGNAMAQNNLGVFYYGGRGGLAKDAAKAAEWYQKAAAQGSAPAQTNLGAMYEDGLGGLAKNLEKAVELYRKAAAQGNENAKKNLTRLGR